MIDTNEISGFINNTQNLGWLHHTYLQCAKRLEYLGLSVPYIDNPFQVQVEQQSFERQQNNHMELARQVVALLREKELGGQTVECTHPRAATNEQGETNTDELIPVGLLEAKDTPNDEARELGSSGEGLHDASQP